MWVTTNVVIIASIVLWKYKYTNNIKKFNLYAFAFVSVFSVQPSVV